jgi:hypothetical protein
VLREVSPHQTEFDVQQYITAKALGPILGDTYCKVNECLKVVCFPFCSWSLLLLYEVCPHNAPHHPCSLLPILKFFYLYVIQFKFPLIFPDTLLVGSTISTLDDLSSDRYILSHAIWSTQNNLVAAVGYSTVVSYDFGAAKAVDFPSSLVAAIHELLKKDSLDMLPPPVSK